MADYQYYEGFILTDKQTGQTRRLSDFGGTIYNPNSDGVTRNLLPEPTHITDKNENQDGERYVKTLYGTRSIEIPVVFSEKDGGGELFELNKWLGKKRQQVFAWEDDAECKEIDVIYQKGFDMDILYGEKFYGLVTLNFIAHNPYWRIRNEKPVIYRNLVAGNVFDIKNKGNSDCFPLIKVVPNGTQASIKIQWNNTLVALTNIDKPFYIDCERERCYEMNGAIQVVSLSKYHSDKFYSFPYLYTDLRNKITIVEGNISELTIQPKTRII